MPNPAAPSPTPAAQPKAGGAAFSKEQVDEIFEDTGSFVPDSTPPKPAAAAPAAPATPPATVPPTEPAPAAAAPADPNAGATEPGTAPGGEAGTPAAPPAAPASPPSESEIRAGVYKEVLDKVLSGKPAAPVTPPPPPPEPPHVQTARKVLAMTEDQIEALYDQHVENARTGKDPQGYKKAETLRALRVQAPTTIYQYEEIRRITTETETSQRQADQSAAEATVKALDANPETKDWRTYRKTMARLAKADDAAVEQGEEPLDAVALYHAAKAIDLRGKPAPLAPAAAAAKAALSSGTPAPRGGPATPPTTSTKPAGDPFVDEIFKEDPSPYA